MEASLAISERHLGHVKPPQQTGLFGLHPEEGQVFEDGTLYQLCPKVIEVFLCTEIQSGRPALMPCCRGEQDICCQAIGSPTTTELKSSPLQDNTVSPGANLHDADALRARVVQLETELRSFRAASAPKRPPSRTRTEPSYHITLLDESRPDEPTARHDIGNPDGAGEQAPERDSVINDAASILEFLAWGRRKNPDFHSVASPEAVVKGPGASEDIGDAPSQDHFPDNIDDPCPLAVLQMLLPSKRQVWQLVDYHDESLLWYHGSYYSPTFRKQLHDFYSRFNGSIEHAGVNLQWVALLFSILAGTITCAPVYRAHVWGFRDPERETLSRRWARASVTCLNRAEYTANHSILSVQAIATLTIAAHMLGLSNMQSIHLAAAVRIAQSLGLHRLTEDSPGTPVEKETGKRVWSQLCSQDWFSLPFSETYLVNPIYSHSDPPLNCHDEDLLPLPNSVPTITSYCRFLNRVANIMPQLQDGLMSCNTVFTRYEQVLFWDKRLRALATGERPAFLGHVPLDPVWPAYVPWARRSLAISSAHKIIMIHRSFLSESFKNPAFAFTRCTCIAASKTIIREYKFVVEEDGPVLWIHQAFSVAASIILLLDLLHRDPSDKEYAEHKQLAEGTVHILRRCQNSMIAARGVKLLSALLKELPCPSDTTKHWRKRAADDVDAVPPQDAKGHKRQRRFDVSTFVKSYCGDVTQSSTGRTGPENVLVSSDETLPPSCNAGDAEELTLGPQEGFQDLATHDPFYSALGIEGSTDFENLLYLANHDFSML
ncbi:uncharacterized protein E0L32_002498 [Thyridium curvatum]|uniref:Transcription factor domain-containing protein n=1 Tax=Thyridium curvatum TaxID=1093900 RepID=A0A507BN39_9PEZI|nr:uncharacterized protein E0L32_002498 [Thyridium curvatum]TPX18641.1 hypothetical protein E0L32_002498 [Thyridium curvatum]